MASPWTDESAILRDLSFAQGRWVPGGIDSAVAGGRPPTLNLTEETEEEYYQRWTTDGDFSAGPDLFRIKRMLELMQDEERPDDNLPSGPIQITKLNPKASPITHTPQLNPNAITFVQKVKALRKKENKDPASNKPRRARNVAIASIMARNNQYVTPEALKLCKPEDFMKPKEDDVVIERKDYIDKVANWLNSQDISSMFKKKSAGAAEVDDEGSLSGQMSTLVDCGTDSTVEQSPVKSQGESEKSSVRSPQNEPYTPSSWADDYYRKAVNRTHMRDLVRDDVWARAEKLMKKIDDEKAEELRKQLEAAELAAADDGVAGDEHTDNATATDHVNDKSDGIAHVLLPAHRHALPAAGAGACAVCAACAAHGAAPHEM